VSNPNVVELPMAPIRRRPATVSGPCMIDWRTFGLILCFLSAASLALGVADVVYTYQTYMVSKGCSSNTSPNYCNPNVLVFTWIASGIWASLPIFIYGLMILQHSGAALSRKSTCFELFSFLCAFIFAPAMLVISAIEVWKGVGVFYWTASQLSSDDTVKAALPIAIAVLGFIEFLMCSIALYYGCCCRPHTMSPSHEYVTTTTASTHNMYQPQIPNMYRSQVPVHTTYERPSCQPCQQGRQPALLPPPQSSYQPYSAKQSFYSAGGMTSGGIGGGGGCSSCPRPATYGGFGGGGGCSSCPRPATYNPYGQMAPNPAYSFYRS